MNKKALITFTIILFLYFTAFAQIDTILHRYKEDLFKTAHLSNIAKLIHLLNDQGCWQDIDYTNTDRANWKAIQHLKRTQNLALAWADPQSKWYHHDSLKQAIDHALNYWLYHRLYNPNWWYNEIGVPRYMQNILILLRPRLTKFERIRGLEELDQYRINGTGTNLIWSAGLGFHYGALTNDTMLMRHCIDTILHEIKITTNEGIQPDYSFHMHGNRLQIFSYGTAFLAEIVKIAIECRGTTWAFPKEKIKLLADFVLKGCQWMCRGINTVPGTIDRSVSRVNALHNADVRNVLPELIELRRDAKLGVSTDMNTFFNRQNGKGQPLTGFRYFPYSDFAAYQCKNLSFFLKTISTRTLPSESINGENLKGHLLNSGDAYLVHNGNEYFNLMPVWNWDKLPGITSFKSANKIIRKPFVGSVSNEKNGLTAMDYTMEGTDTTMKVYAHKIWACHNNLVVCLISGLNIHNTKENIFTVLDQCRLSGIVTANNISNKIKKGTHILKNVRWIQHGNFAYILIKPANIHLYADTISGTWASINASESGEVITDSVFMPVIIHKKQADPSTGYVLTYCPTAKKAEQLADNPSWKIWRNDTLCQAVQFEDGTLMAAFFKPSTLSMDDNKQIKVNYPCLLLLSKNKLYISDPMHHGNAIKIMINGHVKELQLPADGTTLRVSYKNINL